MANVRQPMPMTQTEAHEIIEKTLKNHPAKSAKYQLKEIDAKYIVKGNQLRYQNDSFRLGKLYSGKLNLPGCSPVDITITEFWEKNDFEFGYQETCQVILAARAAPFMVPCYGINKSSRWMISQAMDLPLIKLFQEYKSFADNSSSDYPSLGPDKKKLPPLLRARILYDVARGIQAMVESKTPDSNNSGILYRDISADNIFLPKDWRQRLKDEKFSSIEELDKLPPIAFIGEAGMPIIKARSSYHVKISPECIKAHEWEPVIFEEKEMVWRFGNFVYEMETQTEFADMNLEDVTLIRLKRIKPTNPTHANIFSKCWFSSNELSAALFEFVQVGANFKKYSITERISGEYKEVNYSSVCNEGCWDPDPKTRPSIKRVVQEMQFNVMFALAKEAALKEQIDIESYKLQAKTDISKAEKKIDETVIKNALSYINRKEVRSLVGIDYPYEYSFPRYQKFGSLEPYLEKEGKKINNTYSGYPIVQLEDVSVQDNFVIIKIRKDDALKLKEGVISKIPKLDFLAMADLGFKLSNLKLPEAMYFFNIYNKGVIPSVIISKDEKAAVAVGARNVYNLIRCYKIALEINPETLCNEDAKALGLLFLDLLHNASPGIAYNPDYARVMASLTNYNDVLLHAMRLLNHAEDKPNITFSKSTEKKEVPQVPGLDDTVVAERMIYIPNNDLFKFHLLVSKYQPDEKEQKNLSVDLDKIIEEKGEELAANIEKREKLSDFFAKNEAWKELTKYIQGKVNTGATGAFLDNLITQKLKCEAELDAGERDKLIKDMQKSVQKEMSGGMGLWGSSNAFNKDLQALNNALSQGEAPNVKTRVRLRDRS